MKTILIIEDGDEYEAFASLFLAEAFEIEAAHSAAEALAFAENTPVDGFLLDMRFDRAEESALAGDAEETAKRLFAGDIGMAHRYLKEHQGTLILAELRKAGHHQVAVFVHDFPRGRLRNLEQLYGNVKAAPSFDAALIERLLNE
jgi:hypothetical protein